MEEVVVAVVGCQYHPNNTDFLEYCQSAKETPDVVFVNDPNNEYSPQGKAVKVMWNTPWSERVLLGYVSNDNCQQIFDLIESGHIFSISKLNDAKIVNKELHWFNAILKS